MDALRTAVTPDTGFFGVDTAGAVEDETAGDGCATLLTFISGLPEPEEAAAGLVKPLTDTDGVAPDTGLWVQADRPAA